TLSGPTTDSFVVPLLVPGTAETVGITGSTLVPSRPLARSIAGSRVGSALVPAVTHAASPPAQHTPPAPGFARLWLRPMSMRRPRKLRTRFLDQPHRPAS